MHGSRDTCRARYKQSSKRSKKGCKHCKETTRDDLRVDCNIAERDIPSASLAQIRMDNVGKLVTKIIYETCDWRETLKNEMNSCDMPSCRWRMIGRNVKKIWCSIDRQEVSLLVKLCPTVRATPSFDKTSRIFLRNLFEVLNYTIDETTDMGRTP